MNTSFKIDNEYEIKLSDSNIWEVYLNNKIRERSFERLFKFYSAVKNGTLNENSFNSLEEGYLYLTNPRDFNDPFDCSVNLINDSELTLYRSGSANNHYDKNGVCSLTSEVDNHLMWAHYTNNYVGFAVEFKSDKNIKFSPNQDRKLMLRQVIYSDKPNKISIKHPVSNFYTMLIKLKPWEYEKEWRIVGRVDDPVNNFERKLNYNKNSISAIYVGYKLKEYNPELYKTLIEIIKINYPLAKVVLVKPHAKEFKLDFSELSI